MQNYDDPQVLARLTDTNVTLCSSKTSTSRAKSISERDRRSILYTTITSTRPARMLQPHVSRTYGMRLICRGPSRRRLFLVPKAQDRSGIRRRLQPCKTLNENQVNSLKRNTGNSNDSRHL